VIRNFHLHRGKQEGKEEQKQEEKKLNANMLSKQKQTFTHKNAKKERILNIGTLNCNGINYNLKETMLGTDFENYKLDVLSLQETHLKGNGIKDIYSVKGRKYILYYSGIDENSKERNFSGVGILVREDADTTFHPISDRLCYLEYNINNVKWNIICTYAHTLPNSEKNPEKRERFYDDLEHLTNKFKTNENVIITGDFNAKTGSAYKIYSNNMGKFGKGVVNNNGEALLDFANRTEFTLANTMFQHKMAHRATWICPERINTSNNNKIRTNQIDYILIRNKMKKSIQDARSYHGIWTDTDHRMVIMNIKNEKIYNKKTYRNLKTRTGNFNLEKLNDRIVEQEYKEEITKELQILNENKEKDENTNKEIWTDICEICKKSIYKNTGTKIK